MSRESPSASPRYPPRPRRTSAPATTPAPALAAPVAPKDVFQRTLQRTFGSFFIKSAATAEEKAALQQQKEDQQKADQTAAGKRGEGSA